MTYRCQKCKRFFHSLRRKRSRCWNCNARTLRVKCFSNPAFES
jgi:DNA-directed RNA polymerase subunit RPC12/RpoP